MIYRKQEIPDDLLKFFVRAEIGLEPTPDEFVAELVDVFREVRRVLRDDGTLWLNLGDSYASTTSATGARGGSFASERAQWQGTSEKRIIPSGIKAKDLIGIPWRVAFALQADGWYLRQDIIWSKPNPMPESVTDRCTKAHEYIFLLSKSQRYFYDQEAIREAIKPTSGLNMRASKHDGGRGDKVNDPYRDVTSKTYTEVKGANRRSVWEIATAPFGEAHFATFPPDLIEPCIKAGCPVGGMVLDPFGGAGTTALVADRLGRDATLIELNPEYAAMAERRISNDAGLFAEVIA